MTLSGMEALSMLPDTSHARLTPDIEVVKGGLDPTPVRAGPFTSVIQKAAVSKVADSGIRHQQSNTVLSECRR